LNVSLGCDGGSGYALSDRGRRSPLQGSAAQRKYNKEDLMKFAMIALVASLAAMSAASADTCVTKAVDKNGKPLVGAAKTSFMDKCKKDARTDCEAKAVDKNGKPLAGAAKTSSTKKCVDDATGAM
jgi:hypothetical protein